MLNNSTWWHAPKILCRLVFIFRCAVSMSSAMNEKPHFKYKSGCIKYDCVGLFTWKWLFFYSFGGKTAGRPILPNLCTDYTSGRTTQTDFLCTLVSKSWLMIKAASVLFCLCAFRLKETNNVYVFLCVYVIVLFLHWDPMLCQWKVSSIQFHLQPSLNLNKTFYGNFLQANYYKFANYTHIDVCM